MTTAELVLIIVVVVPSAALAGWFIRKRTGGVRLHHPIGVYVLLGGTAVAVTAAGALAHSAFFVIGGLLLLGCTVISCATDPGST
jgi:hypothetical protein